MGFETLAIVAAVGAVVSAGASVVQGINQYKGAKSSIKNAEAQQRLNVEKQKRNAELLEKRRGEALKAKAIQDKMETGEREAQMGATGLSLNIGTPLGLEVAAEMAQDVDTQRLNTQYDNAQFNEFEQLNAANDALNNRITSLEAQKSSAIWSAVGSVGQSMTSGATAGMGGGASGGASGGAPAGGKPATVPAPLPNPS